MTRPSADPGHRTTPLDRHDHTYRCSCGNVFDSESGRAVCPKSVVWRIPAESPDVLLARIRAEAATRAAVFDPLAADILILDELLTRTGVPLPTAWAWDLTATRPVADVAWPACRRDHWKLGPDLPMDRVHDGDGERWACPGIRRDRSGDCGFTLPLRKATRDD